MEAINYPDEVINGITEMFLIGAHVDDIAAKYGIRNGRSIYHIAAKHGIKRGACCPHRPYRCAEINEIKQMYTDGVPVAEIAQKFHRSEKSIYALMNRFGVRRYT